MQIKDFTELFEWSYQHLALVGYTAVAVFVWKSRGLYADMTEIAKRTVGQIDKMATNCFPTMQSSLQNQDKLLHSVDESLKTIVKENVGLTPRKRAPRRKQRKK